VDDPRPLRVAALDLVLQERVDERAARVTRRRVDDDAGGLVGDQQVLVLVRDPKLEPLRLQPWPRGKEWLELELFAALEAVALRPQRSVQADGAGGDEPLGFPPRRDVRQRGDEPVQPLAGSRFGDAQPDAQTRRAPPSMTVAKRIATPTQMNVSARLKAGQ
jgi:hypothetical protein